jgi:hypothetical protein
MSGESVYSWRWGAAVEEVVVEELAAGESVYWRD